MNEIHRTYQPEVVLKVLEIQNDALRQIAGFVVDSDARSIARRAIESVRELGTIKPPEESQ